MRGPFSWSSTLLKVLVSMQVVCVCVNGITVNVRVCTGYLIAAARGHKKVVRSAPFEVISLCLTNVVKLSTP